MAKVTTKPLITTKRIEGNTVAKINMRTGETKMVKMATDKQLAYIRILHQRLGNKQPQYKNLTIWQATKVIKRLKVKLEATPQQQLHL